MHLYFFSQEHKHLKHIFLYIPFIPLVQVASESYEFLFFSVCDTVSLWDLNLLVCPSGRVNPYLVCVPAKAELQIAAFSPFLPYQEHILC